MVQTQELTVAGGPVNATVVVPGSKSLTNRALVCAALADGTSVLHGALHADDTEAMLDGIRALGAQAEVASDGTLTIIGCGGHPLAAGPIDARLSGTTSRFLAAVAGLSHTPVTITGDDGLRRRPMGPMFDALRAMGAAVVADGECLPVAVTGPMTADTVTVRADVTSQHITGLMLAGACLDGGLTIHVTGPVVSAPYLHSTGEVMTAFGACVATTTDEDGCTVRVAPGGYHPAEYQVPPDATAASYPLAAAAITGGTVTVDGLGHHAAQGDLRIVELLNAMGAHGTVGSESTTVTGTGTLRGIDVDLRDASDLAQTIAVVAAHATGPSRIRGIGFIRAKETNRITNVVHELRRAGVEACEHDDGYTIVPQPIRPITFETYDDHRMAMVLSLFGLTTPGMAVTDPDCVAKTFPGWWDLYDQLAGQR